MLIDLEKAIELTVNSSVLQSVEKVELINSRGRILAEDVVSKINIPPFDKSAMDGYAINSKEIEEELFVQGTIAAGTKGNLKIDRNKVCYKIMTGAKIPEGADMVIMKEEITQLDGGYISINNKNSKANILFKAEDIKIGEIALKSNTIIRPEHISVLASHGVYQVPVFKNPQIAVLATGSELVEPWEEIEDSNIRNSNAYQILAQLDAMGIKADYLGIVEDKLEKARDFIFKAFDQYDIVISSGAVSVGDFDFIPKAVQELGFDFIFHGVKVKPGKRTLFAVKENKYFIGLPGNPVSSFVQFELIVKKFLYKQLGLDYDAKELLLEIDFDFQRKRSDKIAFEPVKVVNSRVKSLEYNGSANIAALTNADAFMIVEQGVNSISKGDKVKVRFVD